MNDMQVIVKFEFLPNEILIECFEYLNTLNIFHSFYQLNNRFNKLIRTMSLHLNFSNIPQSIFNQFCMILSQNQEIKQQIYSLHLSNKNSCWQIQPFLSQFSFNEFIHLRSLTLTEIKAKNREIIKSMLQLIPQVSSFHLIDSIDETYELICELPKNKLRTLTISKLPNKLNLISELSSIKKLTISSCYIKQLFYLLNTTSQLKYLKVQCLCDSYYTTANYEELSFTNLAIHLKQLIIMSYKHFFNDLAMLLKGTPNLKSLTIFMNYMHDNIDADEWKCLITSSLPYINIFKFKFESHYEEPINIIHEKLKKFQSHFWQKQHHWYTEYSLTDEKILIYTIPYISNEYQLNSHTDRYSNELINNTFDNVTNLIIDPNIFNEECQYYFSYVTSITLENSSKYDDEFLLEKKYIDSLKMIVNLSNIKHLNITYSCKLESPLVLLKILKQAQQISSLSIKPDYLLSLFNNNELCKYLNKMIKKLDICYYSENSFNNFHDLNNFCKIFSNINQLIYHTEEEDFILYPIKHLPYISRLIIHSWGPPYRYKLSWLEDKIQELGGTMSINSHNGIDIYLYDNKRQNLITLNKFYF